MIAWHNACTSISFVQGNSFSFSTILTPQDARVFEYSVHFLPCLTGSKPVLQSQEIQLQEWLQLFGMVNLRSTCSVPSGVFESVPSTNSDVPLGLASLSVKPLLSATSLGSITCIAAVNYYHMTRDIDPVKGIERTTPAPFLPPSAPVANCNSDIFCLHKGPLRMQNQHWVGIVLNPFLENFCIELGNTSSCSSAPAHTIAFK